MYSSMAETFMIKSKIMMKLEKTQQDKEIRLSILQRSLQINCS